MNQRAPTVHVSDAKTKLMALMTTLLFSSQTHLSSFLVGTYD